MKKTAAQIDREVQRRIAMRELIDWYCGHKSNSVSEEFLCYLIEQGVVQKINRLYASRRTFDKLR